MPCPKQVGDLCIPSSDAAILAPSSSELLFLMGVPREDKRSKERRTRYRDGLELTLQAQMIRFSDSLPDFHRCRLLQTLNQILLEARG
jgi:hypothetical protein